MNTKSFIALVFLALASSSVNAAPTPSNKVIKTLETLVGQLREEPIGSPNLSRGIFDDIEHAIAGVIDGHDLAEAFGR